LLLAAHVLHLGGVHLVRLLLLAAHHLLAGLLWAPACISATSSWQHNLQLCCRLQALLLLLLLLLLLHL
jgi:hypothetical protein